MQPTQISGATLARIHVLEVIGNGIVGGMESVVLRLVARLPRERFTVTALCPFDSPFADQLRALNIQVVIVPMPDEPPWASIQTTCALVQARGIDVLHAHLENAHALAGLVGSLTARPVLATVHGRQLNMLDVEVQRMASTHVHVVSQHSQLHALGLGIGASHLSWIPNGVDTDVFQPGKRAALGLRKELGISDEHMPLIGFVGRLSSEKGPEVFVRAAVLLRSLIPSARFVMIGDGPMRPAIESMIVRFGLIDRLQLVGVRDDMPDTYRQLDLLVCSSHSEAMPLAVMEAMASALPVVATRVGGVPDLVEPGKTGWLVAQGDFQGIANRVAHVFDAAGECADMGARARLRALTRFDLQSSVNETGRLLLELAGSRWLAEPGEVTVDDTLPALARRGLRGPHFASGS